MKKVYYNKVLKMHYFINWKNEVDIEFTYVSHKRDLHYADANKSRNTSEGWQLDTEAVDRYGIQFSFGWNDSIAVRYLKRYGFRQDGTPIQMGGKMPSILTSILTDG